MASVRSYFCNCFKEETRRCPDVECFHCYHVIAHLNKAPSHTLFLSNAHPCLCQSVWYTGVSMTYLVRPEVFYAHKCKVWNSCLWYLVYYTKFQPIILGYWASFWPSHPLSNLFIFTAFNRVCCHPQRHHHQLQSAEGIPGKSCYYQEIPVFSFFASRHT